MTNEQLIEKILEWEHGCPDFGEADYHSFWAKSGGSSVVKKLEPTALASSNCGTNDYHFKDRYQIILTKHDIAVYGTENHPKYPLLCRLPLTENRDDLIAAVRMVMALEVERE